MQYLVFIVGIVISILIAFFMNKQTKIKSKYAMVISSFLIALVLEVLTFNFTVYDFSNYDTNKTYYAEKEKNNTAVNNNANAANNNANVANNNANAVNNIANGSDTRKEIEIKDVNATVKHLQLAIDTDALEASVNISYADDANSNPRNLPAIKVCPKNKRSLNISPDFYGKLHKIKIDISTDENQEIRNAKVTLNEKPTFNFSLIRLVLVFGFILLLYIFKRTYFKEYSTKGKKNNLKRALIVSAVLQIIFILCLARAYQVEWRPLVDGNATDSYQEITDAFVHGHVDLNSLPYFQQYVDEIPKMKKLNNIYDASARNGINIKFDHAFYNGKYYCYYGVVPTVLFYLPVQLLSGKMLNTQLLCVLITIAIIIIMTMFIYAMFRRKKKTNVWMAVAAVGCWTFVSDIFIVTSGFRGFGFYQVPRLSAVLFAVLGIYLFYTSLSKGKVSNLKVLFGALCMALTVGCRPNYILISAITLALFLYNLYDVSEKEKSKFKNKYINKIASFFKTVICKSNIKTLVCYVIPYVVVGVGLMIYNYVRFDSVFEFGAKYQLTVYDTGFYHFDNLAKIPEVFFQFILSMPSIEGVFPFFKAVNQNTEYMGYQFSLANMGILAFPIMWLIVLLPWMIKNKRILKREKVMTLITLIVGVVCLYTTAVLGAIGMEYYLDFAWALGLVVVMIIYCVNKYCSKNIKIHLVKVMALLLLMTIVITALLCLGENLAGNIPKNNPELFHHMKQMVMFWK